MAAVPTGENSPPLLTEFAVLWNRGLTDEAKLWHLFDLCELFLQRPRYFGAPVFRVEDQLVTPAFSSQESLAEFVVSTGQLDLNDPDDGYDWVRMSGAELFELPVRARRLFVDPGSETGAVIDLRAREGAPPLAGGAPPAAINLELLPDGTLTSGPLEWSSGSSVGVLTGGST